MGKYDPLARYLKSRTDDNWNATFAQVEEKLGFALPGSAHSYRAWWANQKDGNHSQTAGWQSAGWETTEVDLQRGTVRFERRRKYTPSRTAPEAPSRPDLWGVATELTGIDDRDLLVEAALSALIQREAATRLAQLGGTMPDAWAPSRRHTEA